MLNTPSKIGTDSEFTEQKSILISSNSQAESAIDSPLEIPARIQSLQTPYQTIRLNGAATLRLKGSNSILSIPKNALITPSGEPVKGSYELKYRLLNELSALAFHPIDLDYKTKDNSYRFGQAAIIDIQAFKEGDTLKIAPGKSLSLDFEAQKRNKSLQLFYYNKKQKNWEATEESMDYYRKGSYESIIDSVQFRAALADFEAKQAAKNQGPQRDGKKINLGSTALMPEGIQKLPEAKAPLPNQYLVKHFYNPKIIKDLQLRSFGAYNLSELYKVQNQVAIEADYLDEQGKKIEDAYLLTVVDLNFDAAYSFQPHEFICNGQANNLFIIWTKSGKIYSFVKRATVQLTTGRYSFNMQNLSPRIGSIKDLKTYLRFVRKATNKNVTNR